MPEIYNHNFYLIDTSHCKGILGNDFLFKHDTLINCIEKSITINNKQISFLHAEDYTIDPLDVELLEKKIFIIF